MDEGLRVVTLGPIHGVFFRWSLLRSPSEVRPVSDLVDDSSFRRDGFLSVKDFAARRLKSSFNSAALLIRVFELFGQPISRAARGIKTEQGANPTSTRR